MAKETDTKVETDGKGALSEELEALRAENAELKEKLARAEKPAKSKCPKGDHAVYKGELRAIVLADLAWEVGQKVEKSFVDEDATTLVLDHHGG